MWWCDQNNFGDMGGGAFPGDFAPYVGVQGSSHTCINFPSPISSHASLYAACVQWVLNCLSRPLSLHAFPRLTLDSLCAFDLECPSPICVGPKTTHHQGLIQISSSSQSCVTSTLTWQWPLPPLNSLDVFFLFLIMFYLISSPTSISLRAGAMSRFCVLHCPQHSHFCNELIMFPGHTHSQVISSGQEWGSVRKLRLIRVHKATFLFPKTWGRSGVTYGRGNQDQCLQDTTCPSKRSRTQTELSLFPSDVFLLGGQKPQTAEFLGALQTAPLPNFHKCFIPKPCPNKKSPKKVKC